MIDSKDGMSFGERQVSARVHLSSADTPDRGGLSVIAIFQQLHPTARVDQGLDSFRPAFGILSAIAS